MPAREPDAPPAFAQAGDSAVESDSDGPSPGTRVRGEGGIRPWLTLMRPANVVTAWADVMAGFAVATVAVPSPAGPATWIDLLLLIAATTGLYAGGVVLNDVFDADLDARERPERPIPSGRVRRSHAAVFGAMLLGAGVAVGFLANALVGVLAALVAICALTYDRWGKHRTLIGPLNMGACRAGNLMMAVAVVPHAVGAYWYLALLPLAYIAAVTAISRGEVHGGTKAAGRVSLVLIVSIIIGFVALSVRSEQTAFSLLHAMPFFLPFVGIVFPAFLRGARRRDAGSIRRAVKIGVLLLILLDASVAAGFGGLALGALTAALLPVSLLLARLFAVT